MPLSPAAIPVAAPPVDRPDQGWTFGLTPPVIGAFLAFSLVGFLTVNPLLTVASLAVLPFLIALPWRPGEPPALPFVLGFQWLQATAKVFHADVLGVDVNDLILYPAFGYFARVETATWFTLGGLVALALGMRLAIRTLPLPDTDAIRRLAESFSVSRAFWLYLATTFTVTALYGAVGSRSGFSQILLGVMQLKWATYFFVCYLAIVRREGYAFLFIAFAVEFIAGIGFFSAFKTVFFITIITYFAARSRITVGTVAKGIVVVVVLAILGSGWISIKEDYREILRGDQEGRQGTDLSQGEQVAVLVDFVSTLDGEDLAAGFEPLATRLSYVDYFGYALAYVPEVAPHEGGALWGAAVRHILTPRILFPSKPPLVSDSEITNRYTGLAVAGSAQGTSISLGYMGESYVDLGPVWMFVPLFLLGLLRGLMYRFFLRSEEKRLLGYAFVVALFSGGYLLENSTAKLLGSSVMQFIVLALLFRYVAPRVAAWLQRGNVAESEAEDAAALPIRRAWA